MVSKRPRQKEPIHIGRTLKRVMQQVDPKPDPAIAQLQQLWPEIVGDEAADNSRPASVLNGVLTVFVSSSVWIQQLRFLMKPMMAAINAKQVVSMVTKIRFKVR